MQFLLSNIFITYIMKSKGAPTVFVKVQEDYRICMKRATARVKSVHI